MHTHQTISLVKIFDQMTCNDRLSTDLLVMSDGVSTGSTGTQRVPSASSMLRTWCCTSGVTSVKWSYLGVTPCSSRSCAPRPRETLGLVPKRSVTHARRGLTLEGVSEVSSSAD